ncbi:hypothetical protein OGAPHI_002596 [Ogataea philodendri]|uniref:U4/U6.U5 small nuclear ribonucleoprotein 27kDa protein domain-containing protein n=1 Tax=Ogataea philodendri TaxID=1378263 RepID=A0A9P8T8B7_9ASCO|nr:uncharacterized protein OGAPHI_002596 [Ogataea philodendri]KAH3668841.1 hypothetical protein OGAPHI_002596 [Ogataea philodendri]
MSKIKIKLKDRDSPKNEPGPKDSKREELEESSKDNSTETKEELPEKKEKIDTSEEPKDNKDNRGRRRSIAEEPIVLTEEEPDLAAMFGFDGFGSTKNKKVAGTNSYGANKKRKTEYRQAALASLSLSISAVSTSFSFLTVESTLVKFVNHLASDFVMSKNRSRLNSGALSAFSNFLNTTCLCNSGSSTRLLFKTGIPRTELLVGAYFRLSDLILKSLSVETAPASGFNVRTICLVATSETSTLPLLSPEISCEPSNEISSLVIELPSAWWLTKVSRSSGSSFNVITLP